MTWYQKAPIEEIATRVVTSYNHYIRKAFEKHSSSPSLKYYDQEWKIPPGQTASTFLYNHKSPILFHDGTPSSIREPHFTFVNKAALNLFDYIDEDSLPLEHQGTGKHGGLLNVPSRLSAEPQEQKERENLIKEAEMNGFFLGYKGIRITRNGVRFFVKDVLVWNVHEFSSHDTTIPGKIIGQAAFLPSYEYL